MTSSRKRKTVKKSHNSAEEQSDSSQNTAADLFSQILSGITEDLISYVNLIITNLRLID